MFKFPALALLALLAASALPAKTASEVVEQPTVSKESCVRHSSASVWTASSCPICGGSLEELKALVRWTLELQVDALVRFGRI